MSATLRSIQALAVGLCLLAPLVAPAHAQAASPALELIRRNP
ncbi:MAG TPA: hypothetical protein VLT81_13700 [Chondromyces sp.]|nr:hypothetical protein [Chondromyces sp.]